MRVFCSECKYNKDIGDGTCARHECFYSGNPLMKYTYDHEYLDFEYEQSEKNKNNDCDLFVLKWSKKWKWCR